MPEHRGSDGVDAAISKFRESLRPVIKQAEEDGVPPGQQAAIFAHLAYAQYQRRERAHPSEEYPTFEQWVLVQRKHADETQILEGFIYDMEEEHDA